MKRIVIWTLFLALILCGCGASATQVAPENSIETNDVRLAYVTDITNSRFYVHAVVRFKDGSSEMIKIGDVLFGGSVSNTNPPNTGDIVEVSNGQIIRIVDRAPIDWRGF